MNDLRQRVLSGLLAGVAAGLAYALAMADQDQLRLFGILLGPFSLRTEMALQLLFAMSIGALFALFFGRVVATPGSGLMWGVSYGLLWWIAGPLTLCSFLLDDSVGWTIERGRLAFPFFVGYLVVYGAVLGLVYSVLRVLLAGTLQFRLVRRTAVDYLRDMVIGGIAGFVGGLAFGAWMERVGVFPLIAGLVHSDSPDVGRFLHFIISVIIGATYGALFRHNIRGSGSSIAWGVAYGFIWWILGPLTIMPWWLGQGVQWSLEAGRATFPSLVGHLIYGVLLGLVYSMVDRLWRLLFYRVGSLNARAGRAGHPELTSSGDGSSRQRGWRAGIHGCDGPDRRAAGCGQSDRSLVTDGGISAPYGHQRDHRRNVRDTVSARSLHLWGRNGVGLGVRACLVVLGSFNSDADPVRRGSPMVFGVGDRELPFAHRSPRIWRDDGTGLPITRPTLRSNATRQCPESACRFAALSRHACASPVGGSADTGYRTAAPICTRSVSGPAVLEPLCCPFGKSGVPLNRDEGKCGRMICGRALKARPHN